MIRANAHLDRLAELSIRSKNMWTMARKRLFVALMLGCVLAGPLIKPVHAAPILDQSFLGGVGSVSGHDDFSQTFTVGIAGTLSSVGVRIFGFTDVTIDLRPTTSLGVPLLSDDPAAQLGRVNVTPPSSSFALVSDDLSPFGISVRPGDMLAIVLRSSSIQNWGVALDGDATYAGGQAFIRQGTDWKTFSQVFPAFSQADFQFDTFVERIPEPSALTLLSVGLCGLLTYGWQRRKPLPSERGPSDH
jgi:hypothetical protein